MWGSARSGSSPRPPGSPSACCAPSIGMSEWAESLRAAAEAALPPVEGRLQVAGLHGPVEVIRDRWGVPHIYAEDEHDLFFGQGFVVSSERMFQMEFMARAGTGRLAAAFTEIG